MSSQDQQQASPFTLAVCAEMVFRDLPIVERIHRIHDLGFQVEIWDWTRHDIDALVRTGATFSSMTGYIRGTLADAAGAEQLLHTARESIPVAKALGIPRLNLHGTGLDNKGLPVQPAQRISFLVTADALGRWAWHCHLMFHMDAGMFREVVVS